MSQKFITDIKHIQSAIANRKLAIFAGAGISVDAGIPTWQTLINEMKSGTDIPSTDTDFLRIAQIYYNERNQKEYIEKVREILKHKKAKHNEIHEAILELNPEHILTTNFDDLLEQVIRKRSLPFSVIKNDKDFPYALNTNLLVKVHGDLDNTDFVLKEDDYLNYAESHPLTEGFVKSIFASKVVLFVGYGFADVNLKIIVQAVRNILGNDFQNAYLITVDENFHPSQKEYLKNKGINVISHEESNGLITTYINGDNVFHEIYYKKIEGLSDKGQRLYDLLTFIKTYDSFNESLRNQNLIDQIHNSITRFSEIRCLPPEFLASLYPFSSSQNERHSHENYNLIIQRKEIWELFSNDIEIIGSEVNLKVLEKYHLHQKDQSHYEVKLKEIIKTINRCGIFYLVNRFDIAEPFTITGENKDYVELSFKTSTECDCLGCTLKKLKYEEVLVRIDGMHVTDSSPLEDDLLLAYTNYKVGNFIHAFYLYETIATKAWEAGKYITYFITKHNIRLLKFLIDRFLKNESNTAVNEICEQIQRIDLDQLVFRLKHVDKIGIDLLKIIRDEEVLEQANQQFETLILSVLKVYELYRTGGTSVGPNYPVVINNQLHKLISFYTNNYIIQDEFTEFHVAVRKALKALMLCHAIKDTYHGKLKYFNSFFFEVAILYGDAKEIKDISYTYDIKSLPIEDADLQTTLALVNNFLSSAFRITTMWTKVVPNKTTHAQWQNYFFERRTQNIFSNIFLLFSGVKIEDGKELIKNLLAFLKVESVLFWPQIQYLSSFISTNKHNFSIEDFLALLEISLEKKDKYYTDSQFINALCSAIGSHYPNYQMNDGIVLNKVLENLFTRRTADYGHLLSLYRIVSKPLKLEIGKIVSSMLKEKFNDTLFVDAAIKGVVNPKLFLTRYLNFINSLPNNDSSKWDEEWYGDTLKYTCLRFAILVHTKNIPLKSLLPKLSPNAAKILFFFLDPEHFDYAYFKVEWLKLWDFPVLFKKLKKNTDINGNSA